MDASESYFRLQSQMHKGLKQGFADLLSARFHSRKLSHFEPFVFQGTDELLEADLVLQTSQNDDEDSADQLLVLQESRGNVPQENQSCRKGQNPQTWFGTLVPRGIHRAKERFSENVMLAVELANLEIRIKRLQEQYLRLGEKKSGLTQDCPETPEL